MRGYLPSAPRDRDNLMGVDLGQETLRDLNQRRQNLLLELKNYEENSKVKQKGSNKETQIDIQTDNWQMDGQTYRQIG